MSVLNSFPDVSRTNSKYTSKLWSQKISLNSIKPWTTLVNAKFSIELIIITLSIWLKLCNTLIYEAFFWENSNLVCKLQKMHSKSTLKTQKSTIFSVSFPLLSKITQMLLFISIYPWISKRTKRPSFKRQGYCTQTSNSTTHW